MTWVKHNYSRTFSQSIGLMSCGTTYVSSVNIPHKSSSISDNGICLKGTNYGDLMIQQENDVVKVPEGKTQQV